MAKRNGKAKSGPGSGSKDNLKKVLMVVSVLFILALVVVQLFSFWGKQQKDYKVQVLNQFTAEQKPSGGFSAWGVAAIGPDRFVLCDQLNHRMVVFDMNGNFVKSFGKKGKETDEFNEPSGVTAGPDGQMWVMDTWNGAIKGFDLKGRNTAIVDLNHFKTFYGPRGIATDGKNFYLADTGSHRVVALSMDGQIVSSWGGRGSDKGLFYNPNAVAVDGRGNFYVGDADNKRVQVFNAGGKVISQIKLGVKPNGVAVDPEGRLYVVANEFTKVYGPDFKYLGTLKDANGGESVFGGNMGVAVSPSGTVILTGGNRVTLVRPMGSAAR